MDKITVTGTTFCGENWTMAFDSVFALPSVDSISMVPKTCLNDGVVDTIVLVAEGATGVESYQWSYPDTWSLLSANDNTVTLQTDNIGGSHEIFVLGVNAQCGQSADTGKITITPVGADVDSISIGYLYGLPFGPPYYLPYVQHIFMVIDPNDPKYDYRWYGDADLTNYIGLGLTPLVMDVDTSVHNYCVVLQNTSTGCSTRKWLKDVSGTTGYTDTIIDVTPPALLTLMEEEKKEVVEQSVASTPLSDREESEPKVAPKVKKSEGTDYKSAPAKQDEKDPSFTFYPNPARQNIYMRFDGKADQLEIVNLSGITLIKERCSGTEQEVNISNLNIGLYLVKVKFGDKIVTQKLQILK
jgi:hypothetical protein